MKLAAKATELMWQWVCVTDCCCLGWWHRRWLVIQAHIVGHFHFTGRRTRTTGRQLEDERRLFNDVITGNWSGDMTWWSSVAGTDDVMAGRRRGCWCWWSMKETAYKLQQTSTNSTDLQHFVSGWLGTRLSWLNLHWFSETSVTYYLTVLLVTHTVL